MSGMYPNGTTQEQVDRWNGADYPPEYDESDEYPLVPCPRCNDYPCRCLMDDDPSDPLPEGWDDGAERRAG